MKIKCIEKMMVNRIFRISSHTLLIGRTVSGKYAWQEEETRRDTSTVLIHQEDSSGAILYLRALQGHSGRNLIDPTLQDNVVIPSNFFQYIYHVGCAINLHSIINSGLMDKNYKDPDTIDLNEPRHAQYMHKAWKRHHNAVFWVDINLAITKGLKFYQTRSNAIIPHEILPASCIPKVVRMETGEVKNEKVYMSPRPPPKISLKHDWKRELGSEHAQRSEVGQLSGSFQSNQSILNPIRERTVNGTLSNGATRCRNKHRKCARWLPNSFLSWKHKLRRWETKQFVIEPGNPL